MPRIDPAPITGDESHWANVFRSIVAEHWQNRMKAAPPCQFVTELADDILRLSKQQGAMTMEALGGRWTSEMEIPDTPWPEPVRLLRTPKEIVYQMVANRFHDMGPFRVESFNRCDAVVMLDPAWKACEAITKSYRDMTQREFESHWLNKPRY